MDGVGGGLKGRLDQDEGAEGDAVALELSGGAGEGVGGDPFVQAGEDLGMDGFEAEGDFQGDGVGGGDLGQEIAEAPATIADEGRMGFDDDTGDMAEALSDGGMIRGRDGMGIEEAAGVIEFDPGPGGIGGVSWGREPGQGIVELGGDITLGDGVGEGVLPEIAEHTAPGAFAVGEEDGEAGLGDAVGIGFDLGENGLGSAGVEVGSTGPAKLEHPAVAGPAVRGILGSFGGGKKLGIGDQRNSL